MERSSQHATQHCISDTFFALFFGKEHIEFASKRTQLGDSSRRILFPEESWIELSLRIFFSTSELPDSTEQFFW